MWITIFALLFGCFCGFAAANFLTTVRNARISEEEMFKEIKEKENINE